MIPQLSSKPPFREPIFFSVPPTETPRELPFSKPIPKGEVDPLFAADYVISDYSTVIYEAGVLGVPVFLYAYDWDTYSEKRAFNIDLEHSIPTVFTKDPTIIMKCIEEGRFDVEAYGTFVEENIAFPHEASCTRQLCDKILQYMT